MLLDKIKSLGFSTSELTPNPVPKLELPNLDRAHAFFVEAITYGQNVCINLDGDPDGIISGYIAKEFCKRMINPERLVTYTNITKVHGITEEFIKFCLKYNINKIVVVDAGTNDIEQIKTLIAHGVKVLVLDHHPITKTHDDDRFILINSSVLDVGNSVSGAYVTNEVMREIYKRISGLDFDIYMELAALTLVSDICKRDDFNRNVLNNYTQGCFKKTTVLSMFRNKYNTDSVQFLNYVSRTFNLVIRLFGSRFLMKALNEDPLKLKTILDNRKNWAELNRKVQDEIIEGSKMFDMGNFIVLIAPDEIPKSSELNINILIRNYLGVIANKMAGAFGKLVLVLGSSKINFEKAKKDALFCFSARDPFNRDVIQLVKQAGIEAEGHGSAFGGNLYADFINKFNDLNVLLSNSEESTEPAEPHTRVIEVQEVTEFLESGINLFEIALWNSLRDDSEKLKIKFTLQGHSIPDKNMRKFLYKTYEFKTFDLSISVLDDVHLVLDYNKNVELFLVK